MNIFSIQKNSFKKKGFTLVEILVVLGLFSTVMTLASGALFTTQAINVKLQETQAVLDNVNLSMEMMTREIRYGTNFHCNVKLSVASSTLRKNCPYSDQGGVILFFKPNTFSNSSDRVAYYASSTGVLYKDEYTSCVVGPSCLTGVSTTTYQITGDDVNIKSLVFYVVGANTLSGVGKDVNEDHDNLQPLITLTIAGETKPRKSNASSTKFTVQTSISSRELDN